MGEWLIRARESRTADARGDIDQTRAQAVVRGEAVTQEIEVTGAVWDTLGKIAASSPVDLQAHACRVQARSLLRSANDIKLARRLWAAGAAELAATEPEAQRTRSRTAHALVLVFDRELDAARVEQHYALSLGNLWPTGVLTELVDVADTDGRRVLRSFKGRVPTAGTLRAALNRLDASRRRTTLTRQIR